MPDDQAGPLDFSDLGAQRVWPSAQKLDFSDLGAQRVGEAGGQQPSKGFFSRFGDAGAISVQNHPEWVTGWPVSTTSDQPQHTTAPAIPNRQTEPWDFSDLGGQRVAEAPQHDLNNDWGAVKNPPDWLTRQPEQPQPHLGSISPMPPAGIMHPINWLNEVEDDIRSGGGFTWPGRILQATGFQGTDSLGMNEAGNSFFGGPLLGPVKLARGTLRRMDPNATPREQLRGLNEQVEGTGQTLAPIAGVTQPEFLPAAAVYGGIQQGVQRGMEHFGADPDLAEGTANLITLGIPLARQGIPMLR